MKKIIIILLTGFLLFSCSIDDDSNNKVENPLITTIKINLNKPVLLLNQNELIFHFHYDTQKRLIKKTGSFLPLSSISLFNAYFTKDIYTSLEYNYNKVTVENFSTSPEFIVPKNSIYYILNNSNQILEKEIPDNKNSNQNYWFKRLYYDYSGNKLNEIITTFPNMPYFPDEPNDYILTYSEKFYFDTNGNLSKSEYVEKRNGIENGEKVIRIFEDYDSSINPTEKFYLLEEYFYRSLSKNNYRKYREIHYDNGILTSSTEYSWTFNYDSNGNIILN